MALGLKSFGWSLAAVAVLVVLLPAGVSALKVPPVPRDVPVVDQTNTLTPEQIANLAKTIADEREATGNQIAVLMIPSLQGEVLEEYSIEVARGWGIGGKDRNNGVLLFVAKDDRRVRIEVGYGLEGALPDIRAGRIIRDRISPAFRQGKYYEGLQSGVQGIVTAIHGEADPALRRDDPKPAAPSLPWEFILFALFFIPSWLAAILARTKSWWAGGVIGAVVGLVLTFFFGFLFVGLASVIGLALIGLLFDKAVSSNFQRHRDAGIAPSWWAGGTHLGGGGRGGFGGFGGGSFGGGGASGDW